MKLLFFISGMRQGGAERVLSTLVNELSRRGHTITLCTNTHIPFAYPVDNRIKIVPLYAHAETEKDTPWQKLSRIRRTARQEAPAAVISFMTSLNTYVLLALAGTGIPVVASEHTRFQNLREAGLAAYLKRFYVNRLATTVTVLTSRDYDFIGNRLRNKVIMPNPLSFEPVETYNPDRPKRIMACGSVNRAEGKGFDSLVRIWARIAPRFPEWEVDIVGGGSPRNMARLQDWIDQAGLHGRIHLLGGRDDMPVLLRGHAIFALTSRYEGFSMVLAEAMSQGCACISYDCVAGPGEIINDQMDGLLVAPGDEEAFAEKLSRLIEDKDYRTQLATRAIKNIRRFSASAITDKWEELLDGIVKPQNH